MYQINYGSSMNIDEFRLISMKYQYIYIASLKSILYQVCNLDTDILYQ